MNALNDLFLHSLIKFIVALDVYIVCPETDEVLVDVLSLYFNNYGKTMISYSKANMHIYTGIHHPY